MPQIVRVLLDQALDRPLDYLLPVAMESTVEVGTRVRAPLKNKILLGTVMDLPDASEFPHLRPIESVVGDRPLILPVLLRMAKWISSYYLCREEEALRAVLPTVVRKATLGPRELKAVRLERRPTAEELTALEKRSPRQAELLRKLAEGDKPFPLVELEKSLGPVSAVAASLERKGFVRFVAQTVARDPHKTDEFLPSQPLEFNSEQKLVYEKVLAAVQNPTTAKPILLHGVTGSGKTEIYLQAVEQTLALGKSALVLVPEISLAPQTVERFKGRFAERQNEVAVLHSHLSEGERHDEWFKIRSGKARIVIGARSAVFAPLADLGLIVVDEEHEPSYKQEESPKYHGRDVAVLRAKMEPCAILLGSATPSMESYLNAETGKYELATMFVRADDRQLPIIRILDMRVQKQKTGASSVFSPPLKLAVQQRLDKKEQTLLFLNRRGYSTSLVCSSCGHVCTCPDCSIALTYHREAAKLVCHLCGHTARAPQKCPTCSAPDIRYSGVGTEKIEEAVSSSFPTAKVARMDADSMTKKDSYRRVLTAFRKGEIDILVGTQMIAKGLHFPNVTLVGILNADLGLHIPDFRAGERTFQLLTQVAGRAGRGEMEGEVLVQTFTPHATAIQFARHHDFSGFWEEERSFRQQFRYPPFHRMVLLTVRSHREELAEFTAQTIRRKLSADLPVDILLGDAAPSPLQKAKGQFRYQISLRGPQSQALTRHIREVMAKLPLPEEVHLAIDVDPFQLM